MAQLRPHHLTLLVLLSAVMACYFACHQVLGIALRLEEMEEVADKAQSSVNENSLLRTEDGRAIQMFPHPDSMQLRFTNSTSRRNLGDFQGCGPCKCCDAAQTYCEEAPCCSYSINCDAQPFGFCKFIPVACSCAGCL